MFSLGFSEICTILVVCIIVLNPSDLPLLMRKMGKIYATIMREVNHVKQSYKDFEEEIQVDDITQFHHSSATKKEKETK